MDDAQVQRIVEIVIQTVVPIIEKRLDVKFEEFERRIDLKIDAKFEEFERKMDLKLETKIQEVRNEIQEVRNEIQEVRNEVHEVRTEVRSIQPIVNNAESPSSELGISDFIWPFRRFWLPVCPKYITNFKHD
jgi:predicted ribosome quality control (RQC) complex YloA/Tae2 family protein